MYIDDTEISFGGALQYSYNKFPLVKNLPEMKQSDFLKALLQLRGLFAVPSGKNTLSFISFDSVIGRKPEALDWTEKVTSPDFPDTMVFKMENFAQTSWMRYTNDDDVSKDDTDSAMTVENETIEQSMDVIKVPFSGTTNETYITGSGITDRRIAHIPLYTQEDNGVKYNSGIKPRILSTGLNIPGSPIQGIFTSFSSLDFNSIRNRFYTEYQRVIRTPRVVKVKLLLSDVDIMKIDLTRPVFFRQSGQYYVILKLQAQPVDDSGYLCEGEFLEI